MKTGVSLKYFANDCRFIHLEVYMHISFSKNLRKQVKSIQHRDTKKGRSTSLTLKMTGRLTKLLLIRTSFKCQRVIIKKTFLGLRHMVVKM